MKTLTWRIHGHDPSGPRFKLAEAAVPVALRLIADRAVGDDITVDVTADGVSVLASSLASIPKGMEQGGGRFSPSLTFIAQDSIMAVNVPDSGDGTPFTVELDLETGR